MSWLSQNCTLSTMLTRWCHVYIQPQTLDIGAPAAEGDGPDLYLLMSCIRDVRERAPAIEAAWEPYHAIVALLGKHGVQVR